MLLPQDFSDTHATGRWLRRGLIHAVLLLFAALFLLPFAWMLSTSLKETSQAVSAHLNLWPASPRWVNYAIATRAIPFWRYAANTLYLCLLNVAGTTLSCAFVAYGFSRVQWPGRERMFALTLATMMIPFPVLMVPLYKIFLELGWIGSFKPLWVPAFFGSAYNIFLLRQFFRGLPADLTDAAQIDGCGHLRLFWQIVLPLARPALLVVALFNLMFVWNDFLGPLIYLTEPNHFTLALGLQSFQSAQGGTDMNLLMAAAALMVAPVIGLFLLAQRHFVQGINMTGLKG